MDRVTLRLSRARDGAAAEPVATPRGFVLDAEHDWIVEGDQRVLTEILACIPREIARRVGPIVTLRFINAVGRIDAGPLGTLIVRSTKWGEREYDQMIETLATQAVELPFSPSEPTAMPYTRESGSSRVPLHALVWLRHAIDPPSKLLAALAQIVRDPERRLEREVRTVPTELASSISPSTADDLCAGRWPLQPVRPGLGAAGYLPLVIDDQRARSTLDLPENRFVKHFLDEAALLVARARTYLTSQKAPIARQIGFHCDAIEAAFAPTRRAALWRSLPPLSHLPVSSTVLQRRAPYREVFHHYLRMHSASRALPLATDQLAQLLAVKDIALLYEMWCSFAVLGVVCELIGRPTRLEQIDVSPIRATLARSVHARWPSGIELAFNHTYTRNTGFHGTSMSVELRPDIVLHVPQGPGAGLHVFDAKFRAKRGKRADGSERVEDLHKMHAYRDALDAVSAWVLYPGAKTTGFSDAGQPWDLATHDAPPRCGVGAISMTPSAAHRGLRRVLQRILLDSDAATPGLTPVPGAPMRRLSY